MSGLCGFGDNPGMRRLPRPAWGGRGPGSVSVPRLPERRSRAVSGRGVVRSAPCRLTARALSGWADPALSCNAARPAAPAFPAPPQGAMGGVQPHSIAGVQPATGYGPRPSGPGKAAASSRFALPLRRGSVVSTSEAGTDDAGNAASCKAAVPVWRDNGGTTGLLARRLPGGRGGLNSPPQDDSRELVSTPSDGAKRRAEGLPARKKQIVLTALFNTCGFSPAGSGH